MEIEGSRGLRGILNAKGRRGKRRGTQISRYELIQAGSASCCVCHEADSRENW